MLTICTTVFRICYGMDMWIPLDGTYGANYLSVGAVIVSIIFSTPALENDSRFDLPRFRGLRGSVYAEIHPGIKISR